MGTRQECPLSSVLLNVTMEGLATTIKLKKRHTYKKKNKPGLVPIYKRNDCTHGKSQEISKTTARINVAMS